MDVFFSSQLANYPAVWMVLNRTLNSKINKLQERAQCLVHNDNTSFFSEFLQKGNSFTIHHRNILKLALKMYRVKHGIASKLM